MAELEKEQRILGSSIHWPGRSGRLVSREGNPPRSELIVTREEEEDRGYTLFLEGHGAGRRVVGRRRRLRRSAALAHRRQCLLLRC